MEKYVLTPAAIKNIQKLNSECEGIQFRYAMNTSDSLTVCECGAVHRTSDGSTCPTCGKKMMYAYGCTRKKSDIINYRWAIEERPEVLDFIFYADGVVFSAVSKDEFEVDVNTVEEFKVSINFNTLTLTSTVPPRTRMRNFYEVVEKYITTDYDAHTVISFIKIIHTSYNFYDFSSFEEILEYLVKAIKKNPNLATPEEFEKHRRYLKEYIKACSEKKYSNFAEIAQSWGFDNQTAKLLPYFLNSSHFSAYTNYLYTFRQISNMKIFGFVETMIKRGDLFGDDIHYIVKEYERIKNDFGEDIAELFADYISADWSRIREDKYHKHYFYERCEYLTSHGVLITIDSVMDRNYFTMLNREAIKLKSKRAVAEWEADFFADPLKAFTQVK